MPLMLIFLFLGGASAALARWRGADGAYFTHKWTALNNIFFIVVRIGVHVE